MAWHGIQRYPFNLNSTTDHLYSAKRVAGIITQRESIQACLWNYYEFCTIATILFLPVVGDVVQVCYVGS